MRYKALALDLDGTLLSPDETVSAANLDALQAARDAGLHVILASARWFQLAERVAGEVGAAPPVIACSGAQVRRLDTGHDLLDLRLPEEFCAALYNICDAERCIATVALDSTVMVKLDRGPDTSLAPREMAFSDSLARAVTETPRIGLIQGSGAVKRIEAELAPAWSDRVLFVESISSFGKPILTLTAAGADKGGALGVACADLGIATSDVVAFGDSGNDAEMFRVAGASVAMGQGTDAIKEIATFVTKSNRDDGVAHAVHHLLDHGDLS